MLLSGQTVLLTTAADEVLIGWMDSFISYTHTSFQQAGIQQDIAPPIFET